LFEKSKKGSKSELKSREYFESIMDKELGKLSEDDIYLEDVNPTQISSNRASAVPIAGHLMYFKYQAKTSEKLKYYDKNPICYIIDNQSNYFYGINLHYFSPGNRMGVIQSLIEGDIKDMKTGFHKYLKSEVQTVFLDLAMQEWETVVLLPIEKFVRNLGGIEFSVDPGGIW
jgi:hypothetical protein